MEAFLASPPQKSASVLLRFTAAAEAFSSALTQVKSDPGLSGVLFHAEVSTTLELLQSGYLGSLVSARQAGYLDGLDKSISTMAQHAKLRATQIQLLADAKAKKVQRPGLNRRGQDGSKKKNPNGGNTPKPHRKWLAQQLVEPYCWTSGERPKHIKESNKGSNRFFAFANASMDLLRARGEASGLSAEELTKDAARFASTIDGWEVPVEPTLNMFAQLK